MLDLIKINLNHLLLQDKVKDMRQAQMDFLFKGGNLISSLLQ